MTKQGYETELKAMQEKRRQYEPMVHHAVIAAVGSGFSPVTVRDLIASTLDEYLPLPVWVEPQPPPQMVTSGTERRFWTTPHRLMPQHIVLREADYPWRPDDKMDQNYGHAFRVHKPDIPAIVLALLGKQGLVEFFDMVARATLNHNGTDEATKSAIRDAWPRLVALAEKGETP